MALDINQLRYKRVYDLSDEEVSYKTYRITIEVNSNVKQLIVRACCKQEVMNSTSHKIKSVKLLKS